MALSRPVPHPTETERESDFLAKKRLMLDEEEEWVIESFMGFTWLPREGTV